MAPGPKEMVAGKATDVENPRDELWMGRAVALARRGEGLTRPNPPVGAVIVRNGEIVGSGYHRGAGLAHAEVLAIAQAGRAARGATLYCTLEPCSTTGRTGPCTGLIVDQGITRVVAAVRDPNPAHRGRGFRVLRKAGIEVLCGVRHAEGKDLIAPFAKWIETGLPYVTLKMGMTLDGRIADAEARSRWITGPASRKAVELMRRRTDALLVGVDTVIADDPCLLPRRPGGRRPYRLVADSHGRTPYRARLFHDGHAEQTILAATEECPLGKRRRIERLGAAVWILPSCDGRVSLKALLWRLGRAGMLRVQCEGGAHLAEALVRAGLVDECVFFIAPSLLGGTASLPVTAGGGWLLQRMPQFEFIEAARVGDDVMLRARPAGTRRVGRGGRACSRV